MGHSPVVRGSSWPSSSFRQRRQPRQQRRAGRRPHRPGPQRRLRRRPQRARRQPRARRHPPHPGQVLHRGHEEPQRHLRQQPGSHRRARCSRTTTSIKICDNIARLLRRRQAAAARGHATRRTADEDEEEDSSTVEATLQPQQQAAARDPAGREAGHAARDRRRPVADARPRAAAAQDRRQPVPASSARPTAASSSCERGRTSSSRKVIKTRRAGEDEQRPLQPQDRQPLPGDGAGAPQRGRQLATSASTCRQSIADCRIRSVMCAPLIGRSSGKAFGVIQLDTQDRFKKFTQDDLKLLCRRRRPGGRSPLENARMHETLVAASRPRARPASWPTQVQMSFLPKKLPQVRRLRVLRPLRVGPGGRRRLLRLHPAARRPPGRHDRRRGRQGRARRPCSWPRSAPTPASAS